MNLLPHQLRPCLSSKVCLVGLGNPRLGDDALGVRIAEALCSCQRDSEPGKTHLHPAALSPHSHPQPSRNSHPTAPLEAVVPFEEEPAGFGHAASANRPTPSPNPHSHSAAILLAAEEPHRVLPQIVEGAFDHVVFIEAVDFGGRPGAVTVFATEEIRTRFPRPRHPAASLGTLAERIESNGHTKAWVLGVQPASLRPDRPLSQSVQNTVHTLVRLLSRAMGIANPA